MTHLNPQFSTLEDAAIHFHLPEDAEFQSHRTFVADSAAEARITIEALGGRLPAVPEDREHRPYSLSSNARGHLVCTTSRHADDETMKGWTPSKNGKSWKIVIYVKTDQRTNADQIAGLDNKCRYVVTRVGGIKNYVSFCWRDADDMWGFVRDRKLVQYMLKAQGVDAPELVMGQMAGVPWERVNEPFEAEYLDGRKWNLGAAQHAYQPAAGSHEHWDMVLRHCGQDLDLALSNDAWARKANIRTGADYLLHWAACMLREPKAKLPYLFLYGPQNSGKTAYYKALALLMTRGVVSADRALTNRGDFNGELANGVLAYAEEIDVSLSPGAYAKMKDWTTNDVIWIHSKGHTPYEQTNTLHFVQCANERTAIAIKAGDTRVTMIHVPKLAINAEIPWPIFKDLLRSEAPAFMATIKALELPPMVGRLRLMAVDTEGKRQEIDLSQPPFVFAVAEYMQQRTEARLAAAQFARAFGDGAWPTQVPAAKQILDRAEVYLKSRGISAEYPDKKSKHGKQIVFRRAA